MESKPPSEAQDVFENRMAVIGAVKQLTDFFTKHEQLSEWKKIEEAKTLEKVLVFLSNADRETVYKEIKKQYLIHNFQHGCCGGH